MSAAFAQHAFEIYSCYMHHSFVPLFKYENQKMRQRGAPRLLFIPQMTVTAKQQP